ncbi:OmpA family protein [Runella sp.]|uniref:OmpA family protein n=1 Tax=Runella sp. TaxID=1960881 RepID=UPI00301985B2
MRVTFPLYLIVLLHCYGFAQDKIVSKEGVEVACKIISYTPQLIRYTNSSNEVKDSIATEKVKEITVEGQRKIIVLPKSYQNQGDLTNETEYKKALAGNDFGKILHTKTILQGIAFYTGRYVLTSEAQKQLTATAQLLRLKKVSQIEISVHTDTSGKAINNLELSEKRAQSLQDFLVGQGFKPEQVKVAGRGEAEPIFGGASQQALNRRVELRVLAIENVEILYSEKYVPPVVFAATPASAALPEKPETETPIQQPKIKKSSKLKLSINNEAFNTKSHFFWVDYQPVSNRGKRPDLTTTVLPPLGIHYERHVWRLLGFRGDFSAHWWEENKILAESVTRQYTQLFRYQYWTLGGGPTFHFSLSPKWDTYVGMMVTFRWVRASCDCYTLNDVSLSGDPFIGTRYFLGNRIFLTGEVGRHGTSYLKAGAGFRM